jgi:general secretion pathway protein G
MKRRVRFVYLLVILALALGCGFSYIRCSLRRAREATLKLDLVTIRLAVVNYTRDKDRGPQSLQDLMNARYLAEIPTDLFTQKKDWIPDGTGINLRAEQAIPEITSVHSASGRIGCNDIEYNLW